jgi:hypothetical protein
MKNKTLLLVILALLGSRADAQRTLAPALRELAAEWPSEVRDVLAEAGFSADGSILPDMGLGRAARPGLAFQYDTTRVYAGFPDSVQVAMIAYAYPGPDMRVATFYQMDGKTSRPVSRLETVTDALGRVTEVNAYRALDRDTFEPQARLRAFPRGFSATACDSLIVDRWSAAAGSFMSVFRTVNRFDAHGRVSEARTTVGDSVVFRDAMTYGVQDRLLSSETTRNAGQGDVPTQRETFVYEGGRLLSSTVFLPNSQGSWAKTARKEYAHLPEARQRSVIAMRWDEATRAWVVRRVEHAEYDAAERVTAAVVMSVDHEGRRSRHRTTYAYGRAGQLVGQAGYAWAESGKAWIKNAGARHAEAHPFAAGDSEAGNLEALFLKPNPAKGAVQLMLAGTANAVFVYTLAGQLVGQYTLPPGQKVLDLSSLPAGTYQVRARSDEEYYSGQLLIQ